MGATRGSSSAMKCLAALAALALVTQPAVATLTPAQQAAWTLAEEYAKYQFSGAFETMCHDTMAGNAYFNLEWNPAYVPWGGNWVSPATATNCPSLFSGFAASWSNYADWAIVTHLELHAVNADASAVYGTLTLDTTTKVTGNALTNITVGHTLHIGTWNGKTVVTGLTLMSDSAAMAQTFCASNVMSCQAYSGSADMTAAPLPLDKVPAPVLGSVKGLKTPTSYTPTSTQLHNEARMMSVPLHQTLTATESQNLQNLQSYWGAIFKGDLSGAEAYLSPTVTLNWYGGGFEWVPVQGTFIGKSGWAKFFGAAGGNTRNFTILDLAYEGCTSDACVMTWKEHSIVSANDRVIDGFLNWVKYVFTADNLIQNIDVLVDSMSYGAAFCSGFVAC